MSKYKINLKKLPPVLIFLYRPLKGQSSQNAVLFSICDLLQPLDPGFYCSQQSTPAEWRIIELVIGM